MSTTMSPLLGSDTDSEGMSTGSALCLVIFIGIVMYFLVGIVIRKFMRGAEGLEMIPHHDFWVALPYRIRDGIRFVSNGCQSDLSYERI